MDGLLQVLLQGGALGLLSYLIIWTTREGAPKLFDLLGGIQKALEVNNNRVGNLEKAVEDLTNEVRGKKPV